MKRWFAVLAVLAPVVGVAALAGLGWTGGRPAAAQGQDFSKVEIKVKLAAGKVYMLEGAGGNIGVSAGEDGQLLVDDQFEPLAPKIRAALGSLTGGKLKFVLNTHWHPDHTGGNKIFGAEAPIFAHSNVRRRLAAEQTIRGQKLAPAPKEALPVVTYDDHVSVHFNGEEIKIVHYPHGHTDGDSIVFFTGSNVVHMGDDFFAGRFPFVDLESGGSVQGLIDNVGKVLAMLPPDVKVIPGHGPLSTRDDLKRFHTMLVETTDLVRRALQAGKSLEQIQTAGLPESWKEWGQGFLDAKSWLQTIHDSLRRGSAGGGAS
ncbi:MAG TPA: MBL fold metallo-hydrolase [Thermoanaerobaculia bacterium]|nr:MBL fold metallo-hydrolase [Thermoanaerobaculia bacterium]